MENRIKIIQSIPFHELINWSVQYLLKSKVNYNQDYELVRIGDFLTRNKTPILVEDFIYYKRVTIKVQNGGITIRDTEIGKNIGTKKQFIIKEGQFLLSKIDARNGAFGVIPNEVDGAIITGNFWTFDVDYNKINPHFLALITTTPEFIRFCENASNGTTNRHYLQEKLFLEQFIPLPHLDEQNIIVNSYNERMALSVKQTFKAEQLKNEIQLFLEVSLKLKSINVLQKSRGLQIVNFKEVSRWDILFLIGNIPTIESKYPLQTFESVISCFNKGESGESIRINSRDFPNEHFHYIGMEQIEKETGNLLEIKKVKGKEIKSQTIRVPTGFLLYGKLRPYLNKYWLNESLYDNIICSSEFFVFDTRKSVDKLFFKYVLSSNFIQNQISDKTSGARMPRINESTFFNLKFPLPPLETQKEIANKIYTMKQNINSLTIEAEKNKELAMDKFKKQIFGQ